MQGSSAGEGLARCFLTSSVLPLVWILFFLIEEGFALAQRTKGKRHHRRRQLFGERRNIKGFFCPPALFFFPLIDLAQSITHLFVCSLPFCLQDAAIEHGGQSLNQNECGTWVRNINGGVFTSPNYPNTYPPNKECVYILEGTAAGASKPSFSSGGLCRSRSRRRLRRG